MCALVAGVAAGSPLAVLPAADSRHSAGLCCGVPEAATGSARYPGKLRHVASPQKGPMSVNALSTYDILPWQLLSEF